MSFSESAMKLLSETVKEACEQAGDVYLKKNK